MSVLNSIYITPRTPSISELFLNSKLETWKLPCIPSSKTQRLLCEGVGRAGTHDVSLLACEWWWSDLKKRRFLALELLAKLSTLSFAPPVYQSEVQVFGP